MAQKTVTIPLQTRDFAIQPSSVNDNERTLTVVASTGAKVRRYNWMRDESYNESLSLDPNHVRLDRLNSGAPVLDAHRSWGSVADQLGVVERAYLQDGKLMADLRLSKRDGVTPLWNDIKDGIVRNVSMGYQTHKAQRIPPARDGDLPEVRAVDWEPGEISFVKVPADAGAGVRGHDPAHADTREFPCIILDPQEQETRNMPKTPEEIAAEAEAKRLADEAATRALETENAARAAEAEAAARAQAAVEAKKPTTAELRTLGLALHVDNIDAFIVRSLESGKTMKEIRKAEIDAAAEKQRGAQKISGITLTRDAYDTKREGMEEYLAYRGGRAGIAKLDKGVQFRGMSLIDLAKECLTDAGIQFRGMSRLEIATLALNLPSVAGTNVRAIGEGISDLPNIVLNASNKTLRKAYDEANQTFKSFARQATAADFKTINRIQMSSAPSLLAVSENGEIQRGYVSDSKESYALSTYARIVPFTRQVIINDDMDAIGRMPMALGMAAARLESDTVYAQLISNPNMSDGNAVFSSAHGNLAGAGAVISVATLGAGVSAMGIQTGLAGELLNLQPDILLAPKKQDLLAKQFTSNAYQPTQQSNVNPYSYLTPVTEGRLDLGIGGANASTTAWYLICSNGQIDTIEYSYLEGQEGAYMETRLGWEVDGMEMKVRLDIAAKVIDWRGMYKNPGA